MAHEKEYEIIVNGTKHSVLTEVMTFAALVEIAYPGHPEDPNSIYSITFEDAQSKPHEGTLAAGGTVTVKKQKTIFDVVKTIRS